MNKSLKIKLIAPKMSLRPMDSEFKRLMSPSLSLITVAALTPAIHQVYIEDENLKKLRFDDKPHLVGINVNVDTSTRAIEIARKYREQNITVVFGGIHPSANPDTMIKYCDSIVIGDAENVWDALINDLINNQLKPFYHDKVVDLSKVPFPKWNIVNLKNYLYNNIVVTSRGCPYKCNFCYNSSEYSNSSFRNRPIEKVVEEIKRLDTKQVMFIDDNFIGNPKWTYEFIQKIKPMNLTWHAAVSTNIIHHKELIGEFAESGCKSLFIGFESINDKSIKSVQKSQNKISDYEELIQLIHSKNIMINASLVFGFDYDTKSVFKDTLKWLVRNKVETMTAHILTPYPGTKLYEKLEMEGRITCTDYSKYNTSNVVFKPVGMTAKELRNGYLWLYREFYSFKNIIKRKPVNKTNNMPYFLFNFCYRKFGKITSLFGKLGLMHWMGKLGRKLSYSID
jgi:radical SAM superfamily enzyme YgiQ (UPF0313 family)